MIRTLRLAALAAVLLPLASFAAEPAPKKLPPIYDTTVLGKREIEFKKKVCEESNRRLFVNFGTNDCALCRVVNDAITDPKFQPAFLRQLVPVLVDVSEGSPNRELLTEWRIDPSKGLPVAVFFENDGKFLGAVQDGELARVAGKGKEAVQDWLLKWFRADDK